MKKILFIIIIALLLVFFAYRIIDNDRISEINSDHQVNGEGLGSIEFNNIGIAEDTIVLETDPQDNGDDKEDVGEQISVEEQAFNDSGRAKAVESPGDLEIELLINEYNVYTVRGTWASVNDEKSVIEFNNKIKIDYYNDEEVSSVEYYLDGPDLTIFEEDEEMLYKILTLTNHRLIMSYLPRGNTLSYEKVE